MRRILMAVVVAAGLVTGGTAAHAEERPWREVQLPSLWPRWEVNQVAGASATEVWVAGTEGLACVQFPLPEPWPGAACSMNAIVRKWNGTGWENKNPPGLWNLQPYGLTASSPTNVWLEGSADAGTYLARYDGSRWSKIAGPAGCKYRQHKLAVGADELFAVYELSARDGVCLARWKAGTWQTQTLTGVNVAALAATGPGDVYVGTYTDDYQRATYRFTGSTWQLVNTPASHPGLELAGHGARYYRTYNAPETLLKVTATGTETIPPPPDGVASDGYLIDDLGRLWNRDATTLYRYDGTAWQLVPTGPALPQIRTWTSLPGSQGVLWALTGTHDTTNHAFTNG